MTWKDRVNNAIKCGYFLDREKQIAFDHFQGPAMEKLNRMNGEGAQSPFDISKISEEAFDLTCMFSQAVYNDKPEQAKVLLSKINRMNKIKFLKEKANDKSNID